MVFRTVGGPVGRKGRKRTIEERLDGERDEFGEGKVDGHDLSCGLSWVRMGGFALGVAALAPAAAAWDMGLERSLAWLPKHVTYRNAREGKGWWCQWGDC